MYRIKSIRLDEEGTQSLFLVSENSRDFLTEWAKEKRTKSVAKSLTSLLIRMYKNGLDWALSSGKLRIIDGNLGFVELRDFSGVWRVACYLPNIKSKQMVLLREFRGHQGSNKIPPAVFEDCLQLVNEARDAFKKEMLND